MKKSAIAALITGGIVAACVAFVVALFLMKLFWAWIVPDVFPAAVQQGLVAGEISWLTAAKIAICVAVLSGFCRGAQARVTGKE